MCFYCPVHAALRIQGGNWTFHSDVAKFNRVMKQMVDQGADVRKCDCPKCLKEARK